VPRTRPSTAGRGRASGTSRSDPRRRSRSGAESLLHWRSERPRSRSCRCRSQGPATPPDGPTPEEVERVEAEFLVVPVGAGEDPVPVHPAVGDHRRPLRLIVSKQALPWGRGPDRRHRASFPSREDGHEQRGVLDPTQDVGLPGRQVDQLARPDFPRRPRCRERHPAFDALDGDLAGGVVGLGSPCPPGRPAGSLACARS
jgi:hypothetical protein